MGASYPLQFRGGPITLAEYMSEVLTNPTAGYYTQRDVFGTAGDFTTSPEISQMFGEVWLLSRTSSQCYFLPKRKLLWSGTASAKSPL